MKKEKNKFMRDYLLSISLYIIVFLTIFLIIYLSIKGTHNEIIKKYNYDSLKEETIEYLNDNNKELQENCNNVLKEKPHSCREHNDLIYCYGTDDKVSVMFYKYGKYKDNKNYVGEQDWGLEYSKKDLLNGKNIYVWNEYRETGHGNNIIVKTRIKDNWYFYYIDYNYEKNDVISDIQED